jgi:3-(3-hydroxy-phenyl)propionate hydroxylase
MSTSATAETYDVAIVGFGPVGATLAGLLGKQGWRVAVLDKATEIFPLPRAIGLDHEVMRILQGIGGIDLLLPHTAPYRPSVYLGCDKQPILRFDIGPPPFPLGWRPNYTFNQPRFEQWLRDRITDLPSVDVHLGVEVTGITNRPDGATLAVRGGRNQTLNARYLVGCDGAASAVRQWLDIQLDDMEFDEHWLVIDMLVSEQALSSLPDTNVQYCYPQRPSTYVVLPGNHRRWEIMINDGERPEDLLRPDVLWPLLGDWISPRDAELWRSASYRFHAVVARQWRSGRCFLAGDSAHQMPPFLAQGMCQGLRDAANLAWKLHLVLDGRGGSDKLLDSYEVERKPNVEAVTKTVKQLGKVICERDPDAARKRDAELREAQNGIITTKARQDLIPGLKGGILHRAEGAVGSQFPQPVLSRSDGSSVMLDDASESNFRLVFSGQLGPEAVRAFREFGVALVETDDAGRICVDNLVQGIDREQQLLAWFAKQECIAAVVRPDGYVFGVARTSRDIDALLIDLKSQLRD